jgi:hypothetical protein
MGKRMFDLGEPSWPEEAPFHTPVKHNRASDGALMRQDRDSNLNLFHRDDTKAGAHSSKRSTQRCATESACKQRLPKWTW